MERQEIRKEILGIVERLDTLMCGEYNTYGKEVDEVLVKARDWLNEAECLLEGE